MIDSTVLEVTTRIGVTMVVQEAVTSAAGVGGRRHHQCRGEDYRCQAGGDDASATECCGERQLHEGVNCHSATLPHCDTPLPQTTHLSRRVN